MKPCEYAMPFVVCPRANVSLALQAEGGVVGPLTGARSGMKRSPMTRISLEVMVGRGAAAFTASLFCCRVCGEPAVAPVLFQEVRLEMSPQFWAWQLTPLTFSRGQKGKIRI
jgi:hypothetical protein